MTDDTHPEIWRTVPGSEYRLQVSSHEHVRWARPRRDGTYRPKEVRDDGRVSAVLYGRRRYVSPRALARVVFPTLYPPQVWLPIEGYDRTYLVGDWGQVWADGRRVDRDGHPIVLLERGELLVRVKVSNLVRATHGDDVAKEIGL